MANPGKLTGLQIERAKGKAVFFDGGGLYLRISGGGAKNWVFRYMIAGRQRDMGLGSYPALGLAEARKKARELKDEVRGGKDPLQGRTTAEAAQKLEALRQKTFREAAEDFIARNKAGWRSPKSLAAWKGTLSAYVYPILGNLPISAIDAGLVVQVLDPIWKEKPETASRVRGRIEAILDAAKVRGWRDGPNPAQWKGNLAHLLPARAKVRKVAHHAALPYGELPGFFAALRGREGMSARALEFAILTAARTSEALGARWGEINLAERFWTVPADRMKAGREHRVPLGDPALAVLDKVLPLALTGDGQPDPAAPVFPGPRRALPMSNMTMLMLLRRMEREDLTAHGFRSTFSDWAAERTSFPRFVIEMALAHTIGNKVEAAYNRSDLFEKRRQLMQGWARFCVSPPAEGKVVVIPGRSPKTMRS